MVNRLNPEEKSETRNNALLKAERRRTMEKELVVKEKEKRELVTFNIADDVISEIIKIGEDIAMWVKLVDGGFCINDKTLTEIKGIICGIHPYLVKWEGKRPHKIRHVLNDEEIPEGYERRVDLKVFVNGQIVGISLAKSSFRYQLSPYIRHLKNSGLRPEDVITKFRVKAASNAFGTFNVVIFEAVESVKNVPFKKAEPVVEDIIETPPAIPPEWA